MFLKDLSEFLSQKLLSEIAQISSDLVAECPETSARKRFNEDVSNKDRNKFTNEFMDHLSWLRSREGKSRSTEWNHVPESIVTSVIEMSLLYALEQEMSPLHILEKALRQVSSIADRQDIDLVDQFIATVLNETDRQLEATMWCVCYPHLEFSNKNYAAVQAAFAGLSKTYRRNSDRKLGLAWAHFSSENDAAKFSSLLEQIVIKSIIYAPGKFEATEAVKEIAEMI